MPYIPRKVHAIFDYVGGLLLVLVPMFFIDSGSWAIGLPIVAGLAILTLSLLTDYELGLFGMIPMAGHLAMDGMLGALFIASPWLFGFSETVWVPHVAIGFALIGGAIMTEQRKKLPLVTGDGQQRPHAST